MKKLHSKIFAIWLFCLNIISVQAQEYRQAKNSTSWNGQSWSNGLPTLDSKAIFKANFTTKENLLANEIDVKDGIQVTIDSTATLLVINDMKVAPTGKLTIKSQAQLIHKNPNSVNAVTNIERVTREVNKFDYTYFCSPVQGQVLNQIANPANHVAPTYQPPLLDKYLRYFGGWIYVPETDVMGFSPSNPEVGAGTGYIIRGPQSFTTAQKWYTKFSGTANNGNINVTLNTGTPYSSCANDIYSPNLIGNPYPAAIDADSFLTNPTNVANLGGALYFWTHNTGLNPPGVLDYTINDYVVYNLLGGIGTGKVVGDLIYAPSGYNRPTGKVASCQAFFVNGSGTAAFTNDMQDTGIVTENQQFYRRANPNSSSMIPPISKSRIWLSLSGAGSYKEILVGYVPNTANVPLATNGYDKAYDTNTYSTNTDTNLYSNTAPSTICPKLVIQGRALGASFNTDDVIPLGFSGIANTTYTIKAETFDGLFGSQMFWLRQIVGTTITYHDIRTSGYSFTTTSSITDDITRFQIVFKSNIYTTNLVSQVCNTLLTDLNNSLHCVQISGATGYVFEVTDVANPTNVITITRSSNLFSMQMLPLPWITSFNKQYSIRVSPIVSGFSQGFGPACLITTPALPPTTYISTGCGNSSAVSSSFFINPVNSIGGITPTKYRVRVVNGTTGAISFLDLNWPTSSFQLQNTGFIPGVIVSPSTTYSISIALEYAANWQSYGPICTHTKAAVITRQSENGISIFEASTYPNPFAENFKLDINTASEKKIQILVFDMLGRQIEERTILVADLDTQEIGTNYSSGVYNVILKQGDNSKTLRVIKR